MEDDGYDLKWKDHLHDVFNVVRKLRVRETFSDLILHCGGKNFLTHKVILGASSSFFERALCSLPDRKTSVLVMIDTRPDMLQLVLDFIYNGQTFILADQLEPFMEAAEKLEIRGLKKEVKEPVREEVEVRHSSKKRSMPIVGSEGDGPSSSERREEEEVSVKRQKPSPMKSLPTVPSGISIERPPSDRPGPSHQIDSARASPDHGITIKPVIRMAEPKQPNLTEPILEHSNGEEEDEVVALPSGAMKAEVDDPLAEYGNDGGEPADAGEWEEGGGYAEDEYYEGQYDESYAGGEGTEQPQNIPPEISAEGIKPWNDCQGMWIGRHVTTGNRIYFCSVCGYTSFVTGHLRRHSRVHTGEKPHSCSKCGRAFSVKTSARVHERKCSGSQPVGTAGDCDSASASASASASPAPPRSSPRKKRNSRKAEPTSTSGGVDGRGGGGSNDSSELVFYVVPSTPAEADLAILPDQGSFLAGQANDVVRAEGAGLSGDQHDVAVVEDSGDSEQRCTDNGILSRIISDIFEF